MMFSLLEICNWIITILALIGAYLISNHNKKGFYLWIISHSFFAILNFIQQDYAQAALFLAFFFISIFGILQWNKEENKPKKHIRIKRKRRFRKISKYSNF